MGACCNCSSEEPISVSPECRVKVINAINEIIDNGDCSIWPNGLSYGIFLTSSEDIDEKEYDLYPANWNQTLRELFTKIKFLLLQGLKEKKQTLHCIFVTLMSIEPDYFEINEKEWSDIAQNIIDLLANEYLVSDTNDNDNNNKMVGNFDKNTKNFIKFMLSWCFDDPYNDKGDNGVNNPHFKKLREISMQCMDILQHPLNQEYDRIAQCNNEYDKQLIELEYINDDSNIKTQRDLYPEFTKWVNAVIKTSETRNITRCN